MMSISLACGTIATLQFKVKFLVHKVKLWPSTLLLMTIMIVFGNIVIPIGMQIMIDAL